MYSALILPLKHELTDKDFTEQQDRTVTFIVIPLEMLYEKKYQKLDVLC